jgi:transposase-like protein
MSSNHTLTNPCGLSFNSSFAPAFDREQKLEIVRRILFGGERISAVARALDLDVKVIARWRREYKRDPERAFPRPSRLGR